MRGKVHTRRCLRWGLCALVLCLPVFAGGCARLDIAVVQIGLKESPYYHLGDTWWDHGNIEEYYFNQIPEELNEIYRELYARLSEYEDSAYLYAQVKTEDFWTAYDAVLADHPEFFWIGSNVQVQESAITGMVISYEISTTVDRRDRDLMKERLEEAADRCIGTLPDDASDYEKIKGVYEYLIDTTDYSLDSVDNQNIQSALLGHRSVCAGYSRAFQYILHRMGMFCTYVTGRSVSGGDHAWNIVRIDGLYYNVDVTWGDPVFVYLEERASSEEMAMNYNYLCCTDMELYRTHIPQVLVPLPACTDDSYNYYKRNGMYYEVFDIDTIYDALMESVQAGEDSIAMKFADEQGYETALYELFTLDLVNDALQYLMRYYGLQTWHYSYHEDRDFYLITIYWKTELYR